MECPTRDDLLLYIVNAFQEQQEKTALHEHLDACSNCSGQVRALERVLNAMRQENARECDKVMANLIDYLDGKVTAAAGIDLKEHLEECKACQTLQQRLQQELSYEEVMALDYAVPKSLEEKIEKILAANHDNSRIADIVESLTTTVDELVDRVILVLTPSSVPAFLGNPVFETAPIETTATRDLKIDVGGTGRTVKIFSENDVELDRQISGENGMVIFRDFVPAAYKLLVEGFEIKDVAFWP